MTNDLAQAVEAIAENLQNSLTVEERLTLCAAVGKLSGILPPRESAPRVVPREESTRDRLKGAWRDDSEPRTRLCEHCGDAIDNQFCSVECAQEYRGPATSHVPPSAAARYEVDFAPGGVELRRHKADGTVDVLMLTEKPVEGPSVTHSPDFGNWPSWPYPETDDRVGRYESALKAIANADRLSARGLLQEIAQEALDSTPETTSDTKSGDGQS